MAFPLQEHYKKDAPSSVITRILQFNVNVRHLKNGTISEEESQICRKFFLALKLRKYNEKSTN